MRCAYPRTSTFGVQYSCGKCHPCRINRARKKTTRMLLESQQHATTSFVTLTYDEDALPLRVSTDGCPIPSLLPADLTLFLKRARYHYGPFRYSAVGEYGGKYNRPHYHLVMYGIDPFQLDQHCEKEVWQKGWVDVGYADVGALKYISGYVVKGMTNYNDEYVRQQLDGREPEYFRWSLDPTIGKSSIPLIASAYTTESGSKQLAQYHDVSSVVRIGGRLWPLDYYMRSQLRDYLGLPKRSRDTEVAKPYDVIADEQGPLEMEHSRKRHEKEVRRGKKKREEKSAF